MTASSVVEVTAQAAPLTQVSSRCCRPSRPHTTACGKQNSQSACCTCCCCCTADTSINHSWLLLPLLLLRCFCVAGPQKINTLGSACQACFFALAGPYAYACQVVGCLLGNTCAACCPQATVAHTSAVVQLNLRHIACLRKPNACPGSALLLADGLGLSTSSKHSTH